MSTRPPTLVALADYLRVTTADFGGSERGNFGIVRNRATSKNTFGYHFGADIIYDPSFGMGDRDYSVKRARDRAGLSNAASAMDIKLKAKPLRALTAWLLAECKAGRVTDIRELLGPTPSGLPRRWQAPDWRPTVATADHVWHAHISWFRDSEFRTKDKLDLFRRYYEPDEPEEPVNPETVKILQTLLNEMGVRDPNGRELVVDGVFGPFTEHALNQAVACASDLVASKARATRLTTAIGINLAKRTAADDDLRGVL